MSLKFGIYLVEQRIISPEQFCGLVKIQQEATMSLATLAIRKNFMTIKQVARVLDLAEANPLQPFVQIAIEEELIDCVDADRLLHEQQLSCPPLQKLLVECGLLTQRQCEVLYQHFEKQAALRSSAALPATAANTEQHPQETKVGPRQPKFSIRPVVTQSVSNQLP